MRFGLNSETLARLKVNATHPQATFIDDELESMYELKIDREFTHSGKGQFVRS